MIRKIINNPYIGNQQVAIQFYIANKGEKMSEVNLIEKPKEGQSNDQKLTQHLKNLSSAIPADATALYLTLLGVVDKQSVLETSVAFICGLVLLIVIRVIAKAGLWVTLSTTLAYLIWTYAIGDGFFQAIGVNLGNLGAVAVIVYSAFAVAIGNARGK